MSRCTDYGGSPPMVTPRWCEERKLGWTMAICKAAATFLAAKCAEMEDVRFVQRVIRSVGLVPDARGARLYGVESTRMKHMVTSGVLQDPNQLAAALIHLGRSPSPINTYLEVGVWSAHTNVLISAYLKRVQQPGSEFHGYACDRWDKYVTSQTRTVLRGLNITFILRTSDEYRQLLADKGRTVDGTPKVDLCFIDADHNYAGVRTDYEELASSCGTMMFHDVVDFDTLVRDGGGVPIFWGELVNSVNRSRVHEFLAQPGTYPPVLGIGVLSPRVATSDGRIDATEWRRAHMAAGRRPAAIGFWNWLCAHPASSRKHLYKGWRNSLLTYCKPDESGEDEKSPDNSTRTGTSNSSS